MRIAGLLFFLMCLLGCSSFKVDNKSSFSKNKQKTSNYNREYYQKNREKLKLRARERYRRNRKN